MEKQIKDFTDLELAQALNQIYQQLIQTQGNLIVVNQEIEKRKPKVKEEEEK